VQVVCVCAFDVSVMRTTRSESVDSNDEDFFANDYPDEESSDSDAESDGWDEVCCLWLLRCMCLFMDTFVTRVFAILDRSEAPSASMLPKMTIPSGMTSTIDPIDAWTAGWTLIVELRSGIPGQYEIDTRTR
jgi:hypothetical protein